MKLQMKLEDAKAEARERAEALDALQRQREREKAMALQEKPPAGTITLEAAGAGGAVFAGNAEGLSPDLHGASWLVEAQHRQAKTEAMEAREVHYKERCVQVSLRRRRDKLMVTVWRAWGGLAVASRRKQDERLSKMAGSIMEAAAREGMLDGGVAATGSKGSPLFSRSSSSAAMPTGKSPLAHQQRSPPPGALFSSIAAYAGGEGSPILGDHSEWWSRFEKKPLPRSAPVDLRAVV